MLPTSRRRGRPPRAFFALLLVVACASTACVGGHALTPSAFAPSAIAWLGPAVSSDGAALARWRASVGPPVISHHEPRSAPADEVTLVSWNTALGAGDVRGMVRALRARSQAPLVLLLQEVYRSGPEVPHVLDPGASFARRLGAADPTGRRDEIETIAADLGLSVFYVPSMRNGGPQVSDEDRGNAILTDLPLTDLSAIELPFERQRRVAVAATINGVAGDSPWSLRVVSAHLDNVTTGPKRVWFVGSEYARVRQARGLLGALTGDAPMVLGGDFNTWFGFSDRTYVETARAFPGTTVSDRRPTFRGLLRLDHLFFRLPPGWHAQFSRGDSAHGSDHRPLIATIRVRS